MSVPAPADWQDLRSYLEDNQIDTQHLHFHLSSYLSGLPAPSDDIFDDPTLSHQQYEFQETIRLFCEIIYQMPDKGDPNGDETESVLS